MFYNSIEPIRNPNVPDSCYFNLTPIINPTDIYLHTPNIPHGAH